MPAAEGLPRVEVKVLWWSPEGIASTITGAGGVKVRSRLNMREAPLKFEGRRDNMAEKREKPCLIHQLAGGDLPNITHSRR